MKEISELYSHLKASAKSRGIEFSITKSDLNNLSFPLTCPILGIKLMWNTGKSCDNSYSIDRIDSTLGYVSGNLVVISNRANILKRDATLKELQSLAEYYTELHESHKIISKY
jgi:hypothetical protein